MKLNGAIEPHQGASMYGSSKGVRKYRDKRYESVCGSYLKCVSNIFGKVNNIHNNNNINNNTNNNNNKVNKSRSYKTTIKSIQKICKIENGDGVINNKMAFKYIGHTTNNNNNNNDNCQRNCHMKVNAEVKQRKEKVENLVLVERSKLDIYENIELAMNSKIDTKQTINQSNQKIADQTYKNTNFCLIDNDKLIDEEMFKMRFVTAIIIAINFINAATIYHVMSIVTWLLKCVDVVGTIVTRMRVQQSLWRQANAMVTKAFKTMSSLYEGAIKFQANASNSYKRDKITQKRRHSKVVGFGATPYLSKSFSSSSSSSPSSSTITILLWCYCLLYSAKLLPKALCDDSDNFFGVNSFSMRPETTTPEFDYASRGQKKFGDKCDNTLECGFPGSICDPKKKSCQCTEDLPVTNHFDKCGKEAAVNESCFFNEQCEVTYFQTECRDGRCVCRFEMSPIWNKDGTIECKGRQDKPGPGTYIDPAMIGVLLGMALMFVIICVVLRLFSQARWHDNRTIFNTPNPRLMNVSLLRDSKLLHGQERRGSRMSVRAPSRQPSMASLRPHSPNPSLGKTGSPSGSHDSNASATSRRSNSVAPGNMTNHHHHDVRTHHQHQPHITSNPVADSVTVEIIEPRK